MGRGRARTAAVEWMERNAASGRVATLELASLPLDSATVLTREFLGGGKLTTEASRRLEELFLDLGRDPDAVVAHDFDRLPEIVRRHLQRRPEVWFGAVAPAVGGGVEAVTDQVE